MFSLQLYCGCKYLGTRAKSYQTNCYSCCSVISNMMLQKQEFGFLTKNQVCLLSTNLQDILQNSRSKIEESFDSFEAQGFKLGVWKMDNCLHSRYTPAWRETVTYSRVVIINYKALKTAYLTASTGPAVMYAGLFLLML